MSMRWPLLEAGSWSLAEAEDPGIKRRDGGVTAFFYFFKRYLTDVTEAWSMLGSEGSLNRRAPPRTSFSDPSRSLTWAERASESPLAERTEQGRVQVRSQPSRGGAWRGAAERARGSW